MSGRPPHRQSSQSSSRPSIASIASQPSFTYSNPDIFSDDFALEPLDIADGFQPSLSSRGGNPATSPQPFNVARRSVAFEQSQDFPSTLSRARGSQASGRSKGHISIHGADSVQPSNRPLSMTSTSDANPIFLPHRSPSTISAFSVPRTQSPYQGVSGPSHPYGMYPQDTALARTQSIANSLRRASGRSSMGINGHDALPGHNVQATMPHLEMTTVRGPAPSIPVGFPGLSHHYRRRLGPEGEEAEDILGPDGHTEQLPPYSRYPDNGPLKTGLSGSLRRTSTTRNRHEDSEETLIVAQTNELTADRALTSNSNTPLSNISDDTPGVETPIRPNLKARFKKTATRRVWGLPIWFSVVVLVLLIIAGMLGATIGGYLAHKRATQHTQSSQATTTQAIQGAADVAPSTYYATTVTATSLIDATPIVPAPSNLSRLPSGAYNVQLTIPTVSANTCLNSAQIDAWGCASGTHVELNVIPNDYGSTEISIVPGTNLGGTITYGAQPPGLLNKCSMTLMGDRDNLGKGPAYFFQQTFDKLVIVHEDEFPVGSAKRWLDAKDYDPADLASRDSPTPPWIRPQVAKPGQRPWYCFWNGTVLEGFIYVNLNTSAASPNATDSVSSFIVPTASFNSAMSPSAWLAGPPSATPKPKSKRDQLSTSDSSNAFPKIIKLEERRNFGNPVQPYCQQMQVLDDGSVGQASDSTGKTIVVTLKENEPVTQNRVQTSSSRRKRGPKNMQGDTISERSSLDSYCFCEWMNA